MKRIIVLFVLIVCGPSVWGRLGETFDQCTERYGKPISISPVEATNSPSDAVYHIGRFSIVARFITNQCYKLIVTPKQGEPEFTEQEKFSFLRANRLGSEWDAYSEARGVVLLKLRDGMAHASMASNAVIVNLTEAEKRNRFGF